MENLGKRSEKHGKKGKLFGFNKSRKTIGVIAVSILIVALFFITNPSTSALASNLLDDLKAKYTSQASNTLAISGQNKTDELKKQIVVLNPDVEMNQFIAERERMLLQAIEEYNQYLAQNAITYDPAELEALKNNIDRIYGNMLAEFKRQLEQAYSSKK